MLLKYLEENLYILPNDGQVTIPSQRRYVHYWQKCLSFPDGCPPDVNIPEPTPKVLQQIRIYDTRNIETIFIVVSEMHEVRHASSRYAGFMRLFHICHHLTGQQTFVTGSWTALSSI